MSKKNTFDTLAVEATKEVALELYKAARNKGILLNREMEELKKRIDTVDSLKDEVVKAYEEGTLEVDADTILRSLNNA